MNSQSDSTSQASFWSSHPIPEGDPVCFEIGPLSIWCVKEKQELRISWHNFTEDDDSDRTVIPPDVSWQRWAFKQRNPVIELKPVFPDRPVVVVPENPFKIAEDASVRVYVRVPVWVRINLLGDTITTLEEIPIVTLSNTWFGNFQEGELCYWISSGARLKIETDPQRPYLAICPLQLIDRSPDDLNVTKLCLRVGNLTLFEDNLQLWADETRVTYRGKSEISQVENMGKSPVEAPNAKHINEPRISQKKSIRARTFSTFKELPVLGLIAKE